MASVLLLFVRFVFWFIVVVVSLAICYAQPRLRLLIRSWCCCVLFAVFCLCLSLFFIACVLKLFSFCSFVCGFVSFFLFVYVLFIVRVFHCFLYGLVLL